MLQVELKQAADEERYEEAAKLRDEVASLRKELAGSALTLVGEQKVGHVVECLLSISVLLPPVCVLVPILLCARHQDLRYQEAAQLLLLLLLLLLLSYRGCK